MTQAPSTLPPGLRLVLDAGLRRYAEGHVLVGGVPRRSLRLSDAGLAAVGALRAGQPVGPAGRALGRRLLDAGLAHPRPAPGPAAVHAVTTVVPVRDRAAELDRCLASLRAAGDGPLVVACDGSRDPAAVAVVAARHGARVLGLSPGRGPGAARNAALAAVDTPLVAFVDSDCTAAPGWLAALVGHLDDPLDGAVAPRVRARPGEGGLLGRYLAGCSSLDMGPYPRDVRPGGAVAYVPTAALLARTAAIGAFDEALRYGEDVDLVWRLRDAGWRVRYDPDVEVHHDEATSWRAVLARRYRYGTSAGPLAERHGGRLAPAVLAPWPAVVAVALLAGRPRAALVLAVVPAVRTARRLHAAGVPAVLGPAWTARAVGHAVEEIGRASATFAPVAALAAAALPGLRRPLAAATLVALLAEHARRRPPLDPARWAAARLLDHAAYGGGVLRGALRSRSLDALLPRVRAADAGRRGRKARGSGRERLFGRARGRREPGPRSHPAPDASGRPAPAPHRGLIGRRRAGRRASRSGGG